jgi:hypothetical protein
LESLSYAASTHDPPHEQLLIVLWVGVIRGGGGRLPLVQELEVGCCGPAR